MNLIPGFGTAPARKAKKNQKALKVLKI